jgi:hypothetical protein
VSPVGVTDYITIKAAAVCAQTKRQGGHWPLRNLLSRRDLSGQLFDSWSLFVSFQWSMIGGGAPRPDASAKCHPCGETYAAAASAPNNNAPSSGKKRHRILTNLLLTSITHGTNTSAYPGKTLVCRLTSWSRDGSAPQSEKTDEFSTLYICVRKGVQFRHVLWTHEFRKLFDVGDSMSRGFRRGESTESPVRARRQSHRRSNRCYRRHVRRSFSRS